MPRSLILVAALLIACATSGSSTSAQSSSGPTLESQIRGGKPTILAGVKEKAAQKAIMKEITNELGATCDDCHDVMDFSAPTVRKKIAAQMFASISVPLTAKAHAGAVLRCGNCHEGKTVFLGDRKDKERIGTLMKAKFVDGLQKKGGAPVECETCHGRAKDKPFLPRT
jgi:hypothetical protein